MVFCPLCTMGASFTLTHGAPTEAPSEPERLGDGVDFLHELGLAAHMLERWFVSLDDVQDVRSLGAGNFGLGQGDQLAILFLAKVELQFARDVHLTKR